MKNPLLVVDGRPVRYRHLQSTHYGPNSLYPLGESPAAPAALDWQAIDGQWRGVRGAWSVSQRRSKRLLIKIDTAQ